MTADNDQLSDILDLNVAEIKEQLPDFNGDLQTLLKAEIDGQNRKTAIDAIRKEIVQRGEEDKPEVLVEGEEEEEIVGTAIEYSDTGKGRHPVVEAANGRRYIRTGVEGIDALFRNGIPEGVPVLVAGGSGSGKTIFGLQTLAFHAAHGRKCLYMSFEERESALKQHMRDFGWEPEELIEAGNLRIEKYSPFDITRKIEAALAEEQGELLIDIDPILIPEDFDPDVIVVDSLTAVASAFTEQRSSYRIYVDQLFDFFKELGANSFLITETDQVPETFSPSGVEEFLADGVIVLYNFKVGEGRENGIEVLKMRGEAHEKKIVAMKITDDGMTVYPDQQVFTP